MTNNRTEPLSNDAEMPSFKYAKHLNQWKDAHRLGQTIPRLM